ncbi:hypothetical protein EUTSA_v10006841mg [Eutrema salsugineum]|uniref:SAC domain-containing protein n=1 Tax=Eutrema salsugineum TaxID=72664 RepID=V4KBK2_EUTSA|nr:phosphoinositide phosphatase SAC5 [Eutrema salsugineum]ESQ35070.1 hypothetical protein EUTSA_v10006841mg [Eutrema salsugineum]
MGSKISRVDPSPQLIDPSPQLINLPILQEFKLYSTPSNLYLIGRDESKSFKRILKIGRTDRDELNLFEDPTTYTNAEMHELKRWLSRGNQEYGGLQPVTACYGIIGFVRFLEPYYMLLITKRKKVGEICGHTVYSIAESKMIVIPNPAIQTSVADSLAERRYRKLLSMVDLTKNFFFSYTYHLMYSLQKNMCNTEIGNAHDNTMFVWNEYLTHGIRRILQNTTWTVALIYGFFKQNECFVSDEEFVLTVIARRSRHYAGTRYLTRGVNEEGSVANYVETEQIVSKKVPEGQKIPITSIVQIRGSIPLFWSQETSVFNPQPEIILNKMDKNYAATKHHFENLRQRYGKPIIILNLVKKGEKNHRETILGAEYAKVIKVINKPRKRKENRIKTVHFDLNKVYKRGADVAFECLCTVGRKALELTNLFFCQAPSGVGVQDVLNDSFFNNPLPNQEDIDEEALTPDIFKLQSGVLRTNCIDCLDRTNFAQYAHGLVALAHQLDTLGITGPPVVDVNNPLAKALMEVYQKMGNTIALQYGGSDAHIKMFSALRGGWNMVMKQRDIFTAVRRHYNNAYQDDEKQNAINVFLGQSGPQLGRPIPWELDSDQHNIKRSSSRVDIENLRPLIKRSFSDNLLLAGDVNSEELVLEDPQPSREGINGAISETTSEICFNETEPASLSFLSAIRTEDHLRGTGSSQMFPGSSSTSDSRRHDVPGFSHSYKTKFTPVEETLERCSSMSSDDMFTDLDEFVTSETNTNTIFEDPRRSNEPGGFTEYVLVDGFSNDFTQWVSSGRTL